jgi:hypothetical protein
MTATRHIPNHLQQYLQVNTTFDGCPMNYLECDFIGEADKLL